MPNIKTLSSCKKDNKKTPTLSSHFAVVVVVVVVVVVFFWGGEEEAGVSVCVCWGRGEECSKFSYAPVNNSLQAQSNKVNRMMVDCTNI